eukprot:g1948.t1
MSRDNWRLSEEGKARDSGVYPVVTEELSEEQLWEALSKHAECWTGDVVDHSVATATVTKLMATGHERTAGDRLDAIMGRLEKYLLNPSAASAFRNPIGTYKRGAARIITEGLIAGLTPPQFMAKVEGALCFKDGWQTAPDVVFEVAEAAAKAWRTVEEFQQSGAARGESGSGTSAVWGGSSEVVVAVATEVPGECAVEDIGRASTKRRNLLSLHDAVASGPEVKDTNTGAAGTLGKLEVLDDGSEVQGTGSVLDVSDDDDDAEFPLIAKKMAAAATRAAKQGLAGDLEVGAAVREGYVGHPQQSVTQPTAAGGAGQAQPPAGAGGAEFPGEGDAGHQHQLPQAGGMGGGELSAGGCSPQPHQPL